MFSRLSIFGLLLLTLKAGPTCADLYCPQPTFNAGQQQTGVAIRHGFVLCNRGRETIHITEVKPGCGCLKATLDRTKIAPGEVVRVAVEIGTVTQAPGKNSWRVLVRHRDGEFPLSVVAHLVSDLSIQPATLLVHTSGAIAHPFTLREQREKPTTIRAADASIAHAQVRVEAPIREGNRWRRTVALEVQATCPEGRHEGIVVLHTDDNRCPELKVPFTIFKHGHSRLRTTPATVELLLPTTGPLPARVILVATGDGSPVLVERVEPGHPAIRCTWAEGPGPRSTLRIQVDRDKLPDGRLASNIRIHCRQPAGETVTVPVQVRP